MTQPLFYVIVETTLGWMGILGSVKGLRCLTLPLTSTQGAQPMLGDTTQALWSPGRFQNLADRLKAYFSGDKVNFPDELDLSGATTFQRRVWEVTRLIPFGETRSYGWVASQIGQPKAGRAVGQALGRNPLPIVIPCHRVLDSDGGLCGFGGGLEMKRRLLELEGVLPRQGCAQQQAESVVAD